MSNLHILLINGPNLNLLGARETDLYGGLTLRQIIDELDDQFPNITLDDHQTNLEGELVDRIQQAQGNYHGVVLNAGGYSHTSVAIHDAIKAVQVPVVEVHLTNLAQREDFRSHSLIAAACAGSIMGFGKDSYRLAISHLETRLNG